MYCFLLLTFLSCSTKDPNRYYNTKHGFSIIFPKDWEIQESFMGTSVISRSSLENEADQFKENINVVVEKLPKDMGLDEYLELNLSNMYKFLTDFKEIEKGSVELSDNDARWLIYTGQLGQLDMKALVYFTIKGMRAYVITCSSSPNSFEEYKDRFKEIVNSFQLE